MYARARYKNPSHSPPARPAVQQRSIDANDTAVVASDTSATVCMACGFSTDPFVVVLCDGCDNEAHPACVGLTHVPAEEWFCSSCRARRYKRKKATQSAPSAPSAPSKAASQSHVIRREAGEVDEVDGIIIEAFADEGAALQHRSLSHERHRSQSTSQSRAQTQARSGQRKRPRSQSRSQSRSEAESQPRSFRHQLLFSNTHLDDACKNSHGKTQVHGSAGICEHW